MLGLDPRAARATWTVFFIALLIAVVYLIRRTLLIFTVALLFAYLLSPLVDLINRFTPRRFSRNLSLAVVYLLLLAILGTTGGLVGSRILEEASTLGGRLPQYAKSRELLAQFPVPSWLEPYREQLIAALRKQVEDNAGEIVPFLQRLGGQVLSLIGNLGFAILVPILSFFFLKDGGGFRSMLLDQMNASRRALLNDILADVHVLLALFMRALVILSLATFFFYSLFFQLAGMQYGLLLAGIAAVLEFIPVVGPLLASASILLVAAFTGYPHLLWILIFLGVYRLFQDYVLQPYLMSSGIELPPMIVIFGVLAGEQIGGIPGMFLSLPVLATLRVIYVRIQKSRRAADLRLSPG